MKFRNCKKRLPLKMSAKRKKILSFCSHLLFIIWRFMKDKKKKRTKRYSYMHVHGYIIGDHCFLDMVMTSYKIFAQFLSVFFWLSGVDPHSRLQVRESFTGLTSLRWPDSLLELNIFTRAWFGCTVLYIPQPHGQLN